VLWCCGAVVLWCCGAVVLWCCGAVVLWCCGAVGARAARAAAQLLHTRSSSSSGRGRAPRAHCNAATPGSSSRPPALASAATAASAPPDPATPHLRHGPDARHVPEQRPQLGGVADVQLLEGHAPGGQGVLGALAELAAGGGEQRHLGGRGWRGGGDFFGGGESMARAGLERKRRRAAAPAAPGRGHLGKGQGSGAPALVSAPGMALACEPAAAAAAAAVVVVAIVGAWRTPGAARCWSPASAARALVVRLWSGRVWLTLRGAANEPAPGGAGGGRVLGLGQRRCLTLAAAGWAAAPRCSWPCSDIISPRLGVKRLWGCDRGYRRAADRPDAR
jgi:hypothetical protein